MKTQLIKSERKLIIFGDVVIICDFETKIYMSLKYAVLIIIINLFYTLM